MPNRHHRRSSDDDPDPERAHRAVDRCDIARPRTDERFDHGRRDGDPDAPRGDEDRQEDPRGLAGAIGLTTSCVPTLANVHPSPKPRPANAKQTMNAGHPCAIAIASTPTPLTTPAPAITAVGRAYLAILPEIGPDSEASNEGARNTTPATNGESPRTSCR